MNEKDIEVKCANNSSKQSDVFYRGELVAFVKEEPPIDATLYYRGRFSGERKVYNYHDIVSAVAEKVDAA